METPLPVNAETCPNCQVGRIQRVYIPYSAIIEGRLLIVPSFPVWMCDVCHAFMYDPAAMIQLQASLAGRVFMPSEQKTHRASRKPPAI